MKLCNVEFWTIWQPGAEFPRLSAGQGQSCFGTCSPGAQLRTRPHSRTAAICSIGSMYSQCAQLLPAAQWYDLHGLEALPDQKQASLPFNQFNNAVRARISAGASSRAAPPAWMPPSPGEALMTQDVV